jgi:hypothetical protein
MGVDLSEIMDFEERSFSFQERSVLHSFRACENSGAHLDLLIITII